jgi:hypothetical protein
MKIQSIAATALVIGLSLPTIPSAYAHDQSGFMSFSGDSCDLQIDRDVTVTPTYLRVFEDNKTLYKISKDGELWVRGKPVEMTEEQRRLGSQYVESMHTLVPELTTLVSETLSITGDSLNLAFTSAFGEESKIGEKLQESLHLAKVQFDEAVAASGDEYTISREGMAGFEEAFGEDFEESIESVVSESLGSVFMTLGKAMVSGDGNFEQRMEAFGERMERMGEKLELDMEDMAHNLEARGESLCEGFAKVDELENQLQAGIPALASIGLFGD